MSQFNRIETEFDRLRKQNRLLARAEDIQWEAASAIHPTQQEGHRLARIISPEIGFNIHTFRVFQRQIGAGGVEGAFHTHGDAVKYYLSGKGKEIIDKDEYPVEAGDLAFIPANIWHGTENTGRAPLEFIAFHQIPGTQLPVPASWQYEMSDMQGRETLDELLASAHREDPAAMDSFTLYSRRQRFLHELGHELGILDDEFNRRRQEKRYVVRRAEVPWELSVDGQSVPVVAPELGFNIHTLQLSIRSVPPNQQDGTSHTHGEAVHYFLTGRGTQSVADQDIDVGAGDLAFIPAAAAHSIANVGDEPLRLLIAEQLPGTNLQLPTV